MGSNLNNDRCASITARSVEAGRLDVLNLLEVHGIKWNFNAHRLCLQTAKGGNLDTLKWLHEKGCKADSGTCAEAARGGHLEMLKWLRESCHWDSMTCAAAAESGNLSLLIWLRENGCDWNSTTCARGQPFVPT
jgi:hypothetical protein